jgi:hypothetical protein
MLESFLRNWWKYWPHCHTERQPLFVDANWWHLSSSDRDLHWHIERLDPGVGSRPWMKGTQQVAPSLSFLWYSYVESDVLTGQLRIGQRTRSHAIHINVRSRTCSPRLWVVEGAVANCTFRVVTGLGFWLLLSDFPTGKDCFSTHTVVISSGLHLASYPTDARVFSEKLMVAHLLKKFLSSGLHVASYPTDARVFSEKLMVAHLLKKFLFLTKRTSALECLNSLQTLKPRFRKDSF